MTGYRPWLDWLKVLGMAVIIFGHTGGERFLMGVFSPINSKQLGVALFVFVTAFTLAKETRPGPRVVFNRFFEVAVLGLLLSLVLSIVQLIRIGSPNLTNYLPYFFGINVVWENAFPANPTTWYVGTYLHLLVVWAVGLRYLPSETSWFAVFVFCVIVCEIGVRACLIAIDRDFTAYMILTSWLTIFMVGTSMGHRLGSDSTRPLWLTSRPVLRRGLVILAGIAMLGGWYSLVQTLQISRSNPFGRIVVGETAVTAIVTSASVTLLYLVHTLLVIGFVFGLPAGRFVRFLAANTLFVFLAHMPVHDWVTPLYYPLVPNPWWRQVANFVVLFVGLAVVSAALRRGLRLTRLRDRLAAMCFGTSEPAVRNPSVV